MRDDRGKPRSAWASDFANIATIPTMILAGALVGYWLGRWVGDTWFPERRQRCITIGVLYGLATGLYHMVKTLKGMAAAPTTKIHPSSRSRGPASPTPPSADTPPPPPPAPSPDSHDDD